MAKYGTSRNPHGRPKGTGKFGEATCTVRVPVSMAEEIKEYAQRRGYQLPMFENTVSAGILTAVGDEVVESINIMQALVRHPDDTFCVRVQGESMTGVGIMPGDVLVVDRKEEVRNGKIVVAAVHGEGCTVKRLERQGGQVRLMPENPDFEPIVVGKEDELRIFGCVRGVVRGC